MIRCPECADPWVEILATMMIAVGSDGIDYADIDDRNVEPHWNAQSVCCCKDCGYEGGVADFISSDSPWYGH